MILSHLEGYESYLKLKSQYPIEIELNCLNANFSSTDNIQALLFKYEYLANQLGEQAILKESEYHEEDFPYYEMSIFCTQEYLEKLIEKYNISEYIDLIHVKDNEYRLNELNSFLSLLD